MHNGGGSLIHPDKFFLSLMDHGKNLDAHGRELWMVWRRACGRREKQNCSRGYRKEAGSLRERNRPYAMRDVKI